MKKTFKIFLISIFAFVLLSFCNTSKANSIDSISMDIFIDELGNAHITETWECDVTQGTEVYHPYYNLGKSEILNLSVKDENRTYTYTSGWNVSGDFDDKAYNCGINKVSDGVELCWGISSYGEHTYTVSYVISNFVATLNDSQMVYWTLIPHNFSNPIGQVYIKISSYYNIPDTTDVWGYGNYGGTAYVYNGYIEMQSDGILSSDEYMTILVKFPLNTFGTSNIINKDFDYYYNKSQEGSTEYKPSSSVIGGIVAIFLFLFYGVSFSIILKIANSGTIRHTKLPKTKDIPYYRDIPCEGDIFKIYFIAYIYRLIENRTDILGAIILKWIKCSFIRIEQKETGSIFNKESTVIVLKESVEILEEREQQLFRMLHEASHDGILEAKEFEKWCSHSYYKIISWFDEIISDEKQKAMNQNLIVKEKTKAFKIFSKQTSITTPELTEEAMKIAGLKRYLNEYTLIHEREPLAVHLFEDYLIFAQIFGIAKKVAKDFKDIYPEVIEQSTFTSYDDIVFIHSCATHGINEANSARARAESKSRAENYSFGGDGFSSDGGGSDSFGGGGSGGGGFR